MLGSCDGGTAPRNRRRSGSVLKQRRLLLAGAFAALTALVSAAAAGQPPAPVPTADSAASPGAARPATALLAGGCFWTLQAVFDRVDGVLATTTGYAGGHAPHPTYEQVLSGRTGHVEAVLIEFDPRRMSYTQLLDVYWRNIDPTRENQQFCDIGRQYNAVIFALDEAQRAAAEASRAALGRGKPFSARIRTPVVAGAQFFPAEESHQRYFDQFPERYAQYARGCGRERRLRELWGAPR